MYSVAKMKLVRKNIEKNRSVYLDKDHYIKVWGNVTPKWISDHVLVLNELVPGYVADYGGNWISFNIVQGTPASEYPHTPEFVERIYKFCLTQIESTAPWYHGDWTLSNMIINGDTITMIDWDNVGQYNQKEVMEKLHSDLKSAFGNLYVF